MAVVVVRGHGGKWITTVVAIRTPTPPHKFICVTTITMDTCRMQYYICLATRYDLISSIYSLRLITQTYKSVPIISEYSSMLQLILLISELILCFIFRRMICMHVDYIRPRAISPCISPRRPECPQIDRECPHNYSARPGILNIPGQTAQCGVFVTGTYKLHRSVYAYLYSVKCARCSKCGLIRIAFAFKFEVV